MIYKDFKIIDSHCHIFPDKIAEKATKSTDKFYGMTDAGVETSGYIGNVRTLLAQCRAHNVSKCVVTAVATTPHQVRSINEFTANEVKLHPDKFIGLGAMHPESDDLEGDAEHVLLSGLHGIKLHPDIQNFKIDCPKALKIFEICEENRLPVLVHTGDSRFDNSNPDRVVHILESFPELTIIGAHLGGWSVWEEAAEKLTGYKNFYVDTCSSFYALKKETAKRIIKAYGADKVVFGTDFPMWSVKDELDYLFSLGFTEKELENILHNNILNILNIKE
ncbi:MAG: amidohydrolase [Clostridia bacterium]|nr:amidohydrolase [Clostridia bacterium]